jgi:hypothetical protein
VSAVVAPRKPGRPKAELVTMPGSLRDAILAMLSESRALAFPTTRYQRDPVGFFEDVLGVTPWEREADVLRALVEHDRVAVKSGRRVGKSHLDAGAALWFYCSFEDARVTMTSTTARQVEDILWRELCMMRMRGGRCVRCKLEIDAMVASGLSRVAAETRVPRPCPHSAVIAEEPGVKPSTGLRSPDFRMIKGATAREPEAFQGISGANQLFIADEASGIAQGIFDAISGNRAGGGKVLLTGNPTQNVGEFFDAFGRKSKAQIGDVGYHTITISSEDSPNVRAGKVVIPGLATAEYIREREIEWGRESALFKIHVSGEFALAEEGRIFSAHAIQQAEERWHTTPESGRLYIGLDPAGASGTGDETMFAVRRGLKLLALLPHRGLTDEGHLVQLLGLIGRYRLPRETPVVVLDREGAIGSSLAGLIRAHLDAREKSFDFVAVRSSDRAVRQPMVYDRMRDELAANLEAWFRDGGAIVEDVKLSAELHALEWRTAANGRVKLTAKDDIRKALGRSPDRYDALSLACWEPLSLRDEVSPSAQAGAPREEYVPERALDPYAAGDTWR